MDKQFCVAAKVGFEPPKAVLTLYTLEAWNKEHEIHVQAIDNEGDASRIYEFLFENLPNTTLIELAKRMAK